MTEKKVVAAIDIGTTTIRCCLFDKKGDLVWIIKESVPIIYPKTGWVEIDPEEIFQLVVRLLKEALEKSGYKAEEVESIGIATLRNSFTTWSKTTGKPFHNIITWKDLRADSIVQTLNSSLKLKVLNSVSKALHILTRKRRFLAGRVLRFMNGQIIPRLLWAIENYPALGEAIRKEDALFGCVDTWLSYKLTGGARYVTDISNISATALFDPFKEEYALSIARYFGIPINLKLPEIKPSRCDFGKSVKEIFGTELRITAVVSDQGASLYGCGCKKKSSVRLTLGTGTFLSLNTENTPHASLAGLYPVVGYREDRGTTFVAEGNSIDTGPMLDWCRKLGLFDDYQDLSRIADTVESSGGVYFIPAFSGLQAPFNDDRAASGFIGLKPTTTKAHMVRAVLESFAFRVLQLWEIMQNETRAKTSSFRVDGGVSQCEFLLQLIADLCLVDLECSSSPEMTALGAAQLAGIQTGFWTEEDCDFQRKFNRVVHPREGVRAAYESEFQQWKTAVKRFFKWY